MKPKKFTPTLFSCLLITSLLCAQDSLLIAKIKENTFSLNISKGQMEGSAAKMIKTAIAQSEFVLIGEQHGIKEVGQFSKVVFEEALKNGFQYMAIETDPFIASKLEALVREGKKALEAFDKKYPLSIPFYNNADDFYYLSAVVLGSNKKPAFWGLDQVFAAAPRYLFSRLAEIAPDNEARVLAREYEKRGHEGFAAAMETGNMQKTILSQLNKQDFEKLYRSFGKYDKSESFRIIKGIEETQQIYNYWFQGKYYNNNYYRSLIMKRLFMQYYNEAKKTDGADPKVVFKFGANHMEKGLTPTNVFDIGSMVSEMAAMKGKSSLHIKFTAAKGSTHNSLSGLQEFDDIENWDPHFKAALKDRLEKPNWTVVDLRPLRQMRLKNIDPQLKSLIFNYDMWVIPPMGSALSPF